MITRRNALKTTGAVLSLGVLPTWFDVMAGSSSRFKIGACDWSIGQHSRVQAMAIAKEIGLDGVQVSLGKVSNNMHLRSADVQYAYKAAVRQTGVQFGGMAIGELNKVPYKSDPRTIGWVRDSIDTAHALGIGVVLLAFFGEGDLKNDPEGQQEVIKRLKAVAPKAEELEVVLGIESWLSAVEHMRIIEAIDSTHVQVYYDVANSHKMGYNIYEEIRWLGREQICEFHMKENGYLLGTGPIDFQEVRNAIDDIEYSGWMQIEGAVPEGERMLPSYLKNHEYLRSVFPVSG